MFNRRAISSTEMRLLGESTTFSALGSAMALLDAIFLTLGAVDPRRYLPKFGSRTRQRRGA